MAAGPSWAAGRWADLAKPLVCNSKNVIYPSANAFYGYRKKFTINLLTIFTKFLLRHFAKYHFANCRFGNYHFAEYHFVSFRFEKYRKPMFSLK